MRALIALLAACGSKAEPPPKADPKLEPKPIANIAIDVKTPNELFARGIAPTFVVGEHRNLGQQAEFLRAMLFPTSTVVKAAEMTAWPAFPILYGGTHVTTTRTTWPFDVRAGHLSIGNLSFEGDGYALFAAVPAQGDRPPAIVYMGTGTPGTDGINTSRLVGNGSQPIAVADALGLLATGTWRANGDRIEAVMNAPIERPKFRELEAHIHSLAPPETDLMMITSVKAGIATVIQKLEIHDPVTVEVYIYPDAATKQKYTSDKGDGHANPFARALHVVAFPKMEALFAHEATHVIAPQVWGNPGSPLVGEGLAVWVSGGYAGTSLDGWAAKLAPTRAQIPVLVDKRWDKVPEASSYPISGLVTRIAIETVGLAKFRDQIYLATTLDWDARCIAAGTTAAALQTALDKLLKTPSPTTAPE